MIQFQYRKHPACWAECFVFYFSLVMMNMGFISKLS